MRTRTTVGAARRLVFASVMLTSTTLSANAAPLLSNHVPMIVREHAVEAVGLPDPASHLQLSIALPMRNPAALDDTLHSIYDPSSPQYRHYLSLEEFTRRFGPAEINYQKALDFFEANGLHVTASSANRYIIDVDGPVSAIDRVFHLTLRLYRHPVENRDFVAPDREPTVDLDVPLLHVTGLDDYILPMPRLVPPEAHAGSARFTGSGPHGYFLGSDMRAAYYGGTLKGTGQSVGLMELVGYNPSDIDLYFKTVKQTLSVPVTGVATDGSTPLTCTSCDDSEQVLDAEYAISMAPGLSELKIYVSKHPVSILNAMATDTSVLQFSTSWGWQENFAAEDPIYKEMGVQGQTFLTASGDNSSLKASGPWPEEDANITGVGGTDLVTNGAGGTYKSETGWKDSAGGPSLDKSITIPTWQEAFINASNKGSHTLRNVPDVAANANFNMYICATFSATKKGKCEGGWGGTSFASPMWAGFIALANEQAATNGKPKIGFLAPTMYGLAGGTSYHTVLHDVVGGKSGLYTAVKGYDLVTGVGSPRGSALIDALANQ